jgi:hypothetical protein
LRRDCLRKKKNNIVCSRKLQDAPIAQIRGGFINCEGIVCESGGIECLRKLQDALIAQIRGGFINWESDYLRKWWDRMFEKITRRADCANKRRIYKLGIGLFAKVVSCVKLGCATGLLKKTEHIYYIDSFKLFFCNFTILFFEQKYFL